MIPSSNHNAEKSGESSLPPPPPSSSSLSNQVLPKKNTRRTFNVVVVPSSTRHVPPPPPTSSLVVVPPPPPLSKVSTSVCKEDSKEKPKSFADELKSKLRYQAEDSFKVIPYRINELNEENGGSERVVRFVVTSDTHNKHGMLKLPQDADVLLHCGDFTYAGSNGEVTKFNEWLGTVNCKHRIVICGNHEYPKKKEKYAELLSNATAILENSSVCVEGIKIYGTPFVPNMGDFQGENYFTKLMDNTGFYKKEEDLKSVYDLIEVDTDILMTHTPPNKILDGSGKYGSYALKDRLPQLTNLKVSCFGHVHGAYGYQKVDKTLFINASSDGVEQPIVFDYVIKQ